MRCYLLNGAVAVRSQSALAASSSGVSRFRDPGRGQGLAGIKGFLDRWKGKISIRSGTARLSIVPFVLAVLRYAHVIEQGDGGAPEEIVLSDRIIQVLGLLWIVTFAIGVNA